MIDSFRSHGRHRLSLCDNGILYIGVSGNYFVPWAAVESIDASRKFGIASYAIRAHDGFRVDPETLTAAIGRQRASVRFQRPVKLNISSMMTPERLAALHAARVAAQSAQSSVRAGEPSAVS